MTLLNRVLEIIGASVLLLLAGVAIILGVGMDFLFGGYRTRGNNNFRRIH